MGNNMELERKPVNMCMKCNTEKEEPDMVATIKKCWGLYFWLFIRISGKAFAISTGLTANV